MEFYHQALTLFRGPVLRGCQVQRVAYRLYSWQEGLYRAHITSEYRSATFVPHCLRFQVRTRDHFHGNYTRKL